MLGLGPRGAFATYGAYSSTQQLAAVTATVAAESWVFERLTPSGAVTDITAFVEQGATVDHDTTRPVQRSLTAQVRADAGVDWLNDQIRVRHVIRMSDGGYMDFQLGVFVATAPARRIDSATTWRMVTCGDQNQLLNDSMFPTAYTVGTGQSAVIAAVSLITQVIPHFQHRIFDQGTKLRAPLTFSEGTDRLTAVNQLLAACGYLPLWWDEVGAARTKPLPDFTLALPDYQFDATVPTGAVILGALSEATDLSKAANVVVAKSQAAGTTVIAASFTNTSPYSNTNALVWRFKLLEVTDSSIIDQATALVIAKRACQAAARTFTPLTVATFAWGLSQHLDVFSVVYTSPEGGYAVAGNYLETRWTHICRAGAPTTHQLERIVPVS